MIYFNISDISDNELKGEITLTKSSRIKEL